MIGKKINQLATELAPVSTDLTIIGDPISGVSKKITLAQLGAIFSGAVSFYTNLAGFPATGDINVIYCAKDTQKLYLWSGSAYTEVFPSQALLDTYQLRSEKGVSNGYASLDSTGKVPISQLPSSIMEYKGTWNAATNTPTLANGTGDTGDVYICNVAGTVNFGAGPITFAVGDYTIYSGSIWQRSSGAVGTVTSVAASITGNAIGITGSPVTTSGTLAFAFAGTGAQYIKGDGTLATFPSTIAQAERLITEVYNSTGATLTKGTIVYINGGQGNLPTVTKALATGDSTSAQTFGIVQADITNNNNGYVVVAGKLNDLDTQAYTEGTQLYLSSTTAGAWTSTKQYAPAHLVYVGIVVRSHPTQGIVEVKIQNGYELDEIHDVAAQNPDNNDILQYKTATNLWTKVAGTTSNIAEGSNLYYTDARSRAALSFTAGSGAYNSTTGVITIPTNTNQLTNGAAYITLGSLSAGAGISYNNTTGVIASTITQYTDAMARASISLTTTGTSGAATYNSTTGVLNVPQYAPDLSGYVPTSRTLTINGTAFDLSANRSWSVGTVTSVGLSSATSGVSIGSTPITTSGTITLAIATASGSQQGLLSSTDWTTFNNKQNALTNPVTGTGTTNYLPKFTGTSTIGNSQIFDNGSGVGIGTATITGKLNVSNGNAHLNNYFVTGTSAGWDIKTYFTGGNAGSEQFIYFGYPTAETNAYIQRGSNGRLEFGTAATSRMIIDASGNLGLGVTPSAWSAGQAMQIGSLRGLSLFGGTAIAQIGNNVYYNGGYFYGATGTATLYTFDNGGHNWSTAPSGTAGNAISFTQAMTLNASGNLSIGNTNNTYKLDVTGKGLFENNSNSAHELIIKNTTAGSNSEAYLYVISDTSAGSTTLGKFSSSKTPYKIIGASNAYLYNGIAGDIAIINDVSSGAIKLAAGGSSSAHLTIASTGAATFSVNTNASLLITNTGQTPIISFRANGVTAAGKIRVDEAFGGGEMVFSTKTTGGVDTDRIIINSSGNVGIGATPLEKFWVNCGTNVNLAVQNYSELYLAAVNDANSATVNMNIAANQLKFTVGGSERMRITSGGNVLINKTSDEGYKLDVNGTTILRGATQINSYQIINGVANGTSTYLQFNNNGSVIGYIGSAAAITGGTSTSIAFGNSSGLGLVINSSTGAATFSSTIQTASPSSGSAHAWKLGSYAAGGTGTATGVIYIEVNGQVYSIPALLGTP